MAANRHRENSQGLRAAARGLDLRLEKQRRSHYVQLALTLVFISLTVFVVFTHQIFLDTGQVSGWHSLVHFALLAFTGTLLVGTWFTWMSYRELDRQQEAVLKDYSRTKQLHLTAGENLNKSESLLECLFGAITDRILVVDSNNRIIKSNKVAEQWLGQDPSQREFTEIFSLGCGGQVERRCELNLIEYTRRTRAAQQGRVLRGGPDCSMLLSVDTYPVRLPGNDSDLVVAIARDVTRQTGQELAACHQKKMAALGVLAAGFAHDLGNPLASLLTEIELLREEEPERLREPLDTLSGHLERIKRKLSEIVEFSRRPDANVQDADASEAIDYALRLTRFDPRARHVKFELDVMDHFPRVAIKEDDLVLVLINLIVNAFNAMPDGGLLMISADMARSGDILLRLADTGRGMDATTLSRATSPLFTTKNTIDATGTGLGLTMAEQLLSDAGGELSLASEPGRGTVVTLRLPPHAIYEHSSHKRAVQ